MQKIALPVLAHCVLSAVCLLAQEPAAPPSVKVFGANPFGQQIPAEMQQALDQLTAAGQVEGRRSSLTFFRWANAQPPRLAHLGLWGPKVGNDQLRLALALPDLEFVSLYETNVDNQGFPLLAQLPKLRALAVVPIERYEKQGFGPTQWSFPFMPRRAERPRITGESLRPFEKVATLESLNLLDAQLNSADLSILAQWPKLSTLGLPSAIDAQTIQHLQACPKLTRLTIGHREISAAEVQLLAGWKSLRQLSIHTAILPDATLQALSQLESVQVLELMDCGLTDDRLQHLRGLHGLQQLSLARNEIDGPGLSHLAHLKLEDLGLEFNNLRNETLHHLPQLKQVQSLGLSYCKGITNQGLASGTLQSMTHLTAIRFRGLNQLTNAAFDDLIKMQHLKHINIRSTGISNDFVPQLKHSMPNTTVFK